MQCLEGKKSQGEQIRRKMTGEFHPERRLVCFQGGGETQRRGILRVVNWKLGQRPGRPSSPDSLILAQNSFRFPFCQSPGGFTREEDS